MRRHLLALLLVGCGAPPVQSLPGDWTRDAWLAGADLDPAMDDAEIDALLAERQAQHVSVLELDAGLSEYLSDDEFAVHVAFLDDVAQRAHALGMRAVVYFPSLEVITTNGWNLPHSMYKDHPDWVQIGLSGEPNVFYGGHEHWVAKDAESAWMSPNTGYRDYYLSRVRALAATALDGIWADVPVYLATGVAWAGAEPQAAAAFRTWARAAGFGALDLPRRADYSEPAFRAWLRWRHENLADFTEAIRAGAQAINPGFVVAIETFPIDDIDATETGLDGAYRRSTQGFLRVWEVDSVSNTRAMEWSTTEDFDGKIAMLKWARAADRENPSWVFSYGNQPLDAGLVMAAAVATGCSPFESKTPEMTVSVGSDFRARWFSFLQDHSQALFHAPRSAQVGIWYSSPSRDYLDPPVGGSYGMFVTTKPPSPDPDWWASGPDDSALPKPHLGGWRAASHALLELGIPWKAILDPGDPRGELAGMKLVWLPSVAALSDDAIAVLTEFVAQGGVLLATGVLPAQFDESGAPRPAPGLAHLFGASAPAGPVLQPYGAGLAIYRPDIHAADLFAVSGHAAQTLDLVAQLVRPYVLADVTIEASPGVLVEQARPSATEHYLYVVNYSGLKTPLVSAPRDVTIGYRAPPGYRVAAAQSATPDAAGQTGPLALAPDVDGVGRITVHVDQFALVTLTLAPARASLPPPTSAQSPEVRSGLK